MKQANRLTSFKVTMAASDFDKMECGVPGKCAGANGSRRVHPHVALTLVAFNPGGLTLRCHDRKGQPEQTLYHFKMPKAATDMQLSYDLSKDVDPTAFARKVEELKRTWVGRTFTFKFLDASKSQTTAKSRERQPGVNKKRKEREAAGKPDRKDYPKTGRRLIAEAARLVSKVMAEQKNKAV